MIQSITIFDPYTGRDHVVDGRMVPFQTLRSWYIKVSKSEGNFSENIKRRESFPKKDDDITSEDLESVLKKVFKERERNFSGLRVGNATVETDGNRTWKSSISIPGSKSSTIWYWRDDKNYDWRCRLIATKDEDKAAQAYEDAKSSIDNCFGEKIKFTESESGKQVITKRYSGGGVTLSLRTYQSSGNYDVTITIVAR